MRRLHGFGYALLATVIATSVAHAQSSTPPTTTVHSYKKKDGTVVQSYKRTIPDGTKRNNFSTKGNVNPYTGKKGTKSEAPGKGSHIAAPRASHAPRARSSGPRSSGKGGSHKGRR